jgi:hypothetical protein
MIISESVQLPLSGEQLEVHFRWTLPTLTLCHYSSKVYSNGICTQISDYAWRPG